MPFRILLILTLSWSVWTGAQTQDTSRLEEAAPLEKSLLSLDAKVNDILSRKAKISARAEIISRRMTLYQDRESLNARQHRNLSQLLGQAQQLERERLECDTELPQVTTRMDSVLRHLAAVYDRQIASIMRILEEDNSPQKESAQKQLSQLLEKKRIINQQMNAIPPRPALQQITWQPEDPPEKMRFKGDLLSDQADILNQELALIDRRITSLRQEKNLRQRLTEMAMEVDLFNQREEVMETPLSPDGLNNLTYWNNRDTENGGVGNNALTPTRFETTENPALDEASAGSRDPETIQGAIDALARYRRSIAAQADSLTRQAQRYYKNANKR